MFEDESSRRRIFNFLLYNLLSASHVTFPSFRPEFTFWGIFYLSARVNNEKRARQATLKTNGNEESSNDELQLLSF